MNGVAPCGKWTTLSLSAIPAKQSVVISVPAERTRVALTITELHVGGAEKCLTQLATRLDPARFSPTVIVLDAEPQGDRAALVRELRSHHVPVHFLGTTRSTQVLRAVRDCRRRLQEIRPHVVQSFLYHANVVTGLAARRLGIPTVLAGIRVADPSRWRSFVERHTRRLFDGFVCVSEAVANHVKNFMPSHGPPLHVIGNGVDLPQVTPLAKSALNIDEAAPVAAYVGRLTKQKGLDRLIRQWRRVVERLPTAHLLLVGDGEDRATLETLTRQLGLAERVRFLGWLAQPLPIIAAADLFVLPSRWEGMPNALLEAAALSKPIVATACEGVEGLLAHHPQQIVAQDEFDASFADRVSELLNDAPLRDELGAANLGVVRQQFTVDQMVRSYEQLFLTTS